MNANIIRCATLGAALASPVWSQDGQTFFNTSGAAIAGFRVMSIGGIEGQTVAGAPYSAEETTQTTQTLSDGNRIVNTSKSKVYRDQQGRRRVEQSMTSIGGMPAVEAHAMITIDDPTTNIHYVLHPHNRTAEKIESNVGGVATKELAVKQLAEATASLHQQLDVTHVRMRSAEGAGVPASEQATMVFKMAGEENARAEETLGTQNMEGVQVQGKRTTTTIPAGAMGNERPIQIVDERWYSPELQMNIMTKHTDPRMGETVFSVTNVSRANPELSLFQLPSDYQVNSSKNMIYKFNRTVAHEE